MHKFILSREKARLAARRMILGGVLIGMAGAGVMAVLGDNPFTEGKAKLVIEKKPELILIDPARRTRATLLT
jgi:hypothetical protein